MVMTKSEALKILELGQGSTPEEIRSSYKKLALKWHPDKHNNSTESTKKFQEISEAYKRLTSNEDDDDVKISMADMFDLFAHIFFSTSGYFVNDRLFYSDDDDDDDDYLYMQPSDSSDDDVPVYRSRQHHAKYSDLMASRVSRAAATAYRNEMRKKKAKVQPEISEEQAKKNADELIKEEEKLKKKAEKRRARKKRNRANRKQREKELKADGKEEENDEECEDESTTHNRERRDSSKENENHTNIEHGTKTNRNKKPAEEEESENERAHDETWDTSSAFFNHAAARRGPVHTNNHNLNSETTNSADPSVNRNEYNTQTSRENRPEEAEKDHIVEQSRHLAAIGNNQANEGNYVEAIEYFTQAISLHNRDFRFFGNRSYCYDRLGDYSKALQDAEVTIMLVPHWAKGYFRKGRALAGLKQYADAEKAFLQVLKHDRHCEDAKFELTRVRVQQLKDMGFGHAQSERAVRLYGTVHAALDALLSGKVKNLVATEEEMYVSDGEVDDQDSEARQRYSEPLASLWVGNIDSKQVTERQLIQLFSKFGKISLIRILPQSFCAFVNYENKESASKAMQSLQGYMIGGQNIIIRYQGNEKFSKNAKPTGPVNGNECYFWRTTGCAYGDKCHFAHLPGSKGVDIQKVELKYGKIKKKGR